MVKRPLVRAPQITVLDLIRQEAEWVRGGQVSGPDELRVSPASSTDSDFIPVTLKTAPAEDKGCAFGREDTLVAAVATARAGRTA
jgi:hypothetical protein